MKRWQFVLALSVVAVVFLLWRYSDRQIIERKTEGFLDVLSMGRDVGSGGRKLKVYKLSNLLAKSIEIEAPFLDDKKREVYREDVESAYAWLCDVAVQTNFEIDEIEAIEVLDGKAQLQCTVDGLAEMEHVRSIDGMYRVIFRWDMIDDQWRLVGMDWKKLP